MLTNNEKIHNCILILGVGRYIGGYVSKKPLGFKNKPKNKFGAFELLETCCTAICIYYVESRIALHLKQCPSRGKKPLAGGRPFQVLNLETL